MSSCRRKGEKRESLPIHRQFFLRGTSAEWQPTGRVWEAADNSVIDFGGRKCEEGKEFTGFWKSPLSRIVCIRIFTVRNSLVQYQKASSEEASTIGPTSSRNTRRNGQERAGGLLFATRPRASSPAGFGSWERLRLLPRTSSWSESDASAVDDREVLWGEMGLISRRFAVKRSFCRWDAVCTARNESWRWSNSAMRNEAPYEGKN